MQLTNIKKTYDAKNQSAHGETTDIEDAFIAILEEIDREKDVSLKEKEKKSAKQEKMNEFNLKFGMFGDKPREKVVVVDVESDSGDSPQRSPRRSPRKKPEEAATESPSGPPALKKARADPRRSSTSSDPGSVSSFDQELKEMMGLMKTAQAKQKAYLEAKSLQEQQSNLFQQQMLAELRKMNASRERE